MTMVIAIGIAAGIAGGAYCGRFIESQLYGVKPFDLPVFLAAAGALTAAPIQRPSEPVRAAEIPASRRIPGVWAVPQSRSVGRMTLTMVRL